MNSTERLRILIVLCVALAANTWAPPASSVQSISSLILLLLPGFTLGSIFFQSVLRTVAGVSLCGSFALGISALVVYFLHLIPGPFPSIVFLFSIILLTVAPFLLRFKESKESEESSTSFWMPVVFLIILAVALFVRFSYVGHSEFQGDEARALHFAAGILHGNDDLLFIHKKGPVEALLPTAILALSSGVIDEFGARLPFTFAGLLIVSLAYALARELWKGRLWIGCYAAGIMAMEGFLIAFSRIVQYQTPLVAFAGSSWFCALRGWPIGAAVFSALALLCHYDAVFTFPAVGLSLLITLKSSGQKFSVGRIALSILAFGLITTSFYLPFVTHEHFAVTTQYLGTRIGANRLPFNNIAHYINLLSFYSPTFYVYTLVLLFLGVLGTTLVEGTKRHWIVAAYICISFFIVTFLPLPLIIPNWGSIAVFIAAIPFVALLVAPRTSFAVRVSFLFVVPSLFAFGFFSVRPNTHFYVGHLGTAIIAAYGLSTVSLKWQRATICFCVLISLVTIPYLYIAYVRRVPEYVHQFPKIRPLLYAAPYGRKFPKGAYFGFPHLSGWKAPATLYNQGILSGSYSSNEESLISSWYLREHHRVELKREGAPDNYFLVKYPNDAVYTNLPRVRREYFLLGKVSWHGRKIMHIYTRKKPEGPERVFDVKSLNNEFDAVPVGNYDTTAAVQN